MDTLITEDFLDYDHQLAVVYKDGSTENFCIPYDWVDMEREEVLDWVVEFNDLDKDQINLDQSTSING